MALVPLERWGTSPLSKRYILPSHAPYTTRQASHFPRRNPQDFLHLSIPVRPGVGAGKLAILVWDLPREQGINETAVCCQQRIFGTTVEIDIRQRGDARRRQIAKEFIYIVRCARGTILRSESG